MSTKHQNIRDIPLLAFWATILLGALALTAMSYYLVFGLISSVHIAPTAQGPVLAVSTATADLKPGDWVLRAPIDQPEELNEAQVARVSPEIPAIWIARASDTGAQSVEFPVRGESFLRPIAKLPGWMSGS